MLNIHTGEADSFLYKVVRDDIYPFLGGGNKGRKIEYIARDIERTSSDAIVTTGGIQSNHCRAVALYAAYRKIKCTLVLHGSKKDFSCQGGNARVMRDTSVNCVFVDQAMDIGPAMDRAMTAYQNQGLNPYYLQGGGHTLEGGLAYIDAIEELKAYCIENDWSPHYIFHASGTGSTQSGILAGLDKHEFINTQVIGISVGRKREAAEKVVKEFYSELCEHHEISCTDRAVVVLDDYLCGGYGQANEAIENLSKRSLRDFGFMLDYTYTAKGFYGMQQYIKQNKLEGKNILFWHTGGVFNYLAE
ncbi:MAG: pyridoxal-phosphate dependent enzyme [Idiomarina sp.]|nr:pyridoxal-phosphate dependent enzyme [Idiomarina sp.]